MPWVLGLVLKALQFRFISTRRCICNSLTKRNWELDREFPSTSLRKEEESRARASSRDRRKGQNSYTERKTVGSCSRRDACSFLHTHATGHRDDKAERSGRRKKISPRASILSSTESERTDWRKSLDSLKASPAIKGDNSLCLLRARWKRSSCDYRHHPVCRGYKSGNRCFHGYPQREVEKKVLKKQLPFWGKKKSKVVYPKHSANEFHSTESWRIGIELFGGIHLKFSGCTWYEIEFGKEKGNLEALSEKAILMSEILARPVVRRTTWRNFTTRRLAQSSVEFGEKDAS